MRKQWSALLTAAVVCLIFAAGNVFAQTVYPVCNNNAAYIGNVVLWFNCGGATTPGPAVPVMPGACINTWPIPPMCTIVDVEINGIRYTIPYSGPLPSPFTWLNATPTGATFW